ncbi:hypothetical protein NEOKW01_1621 [Nematocida sp. AWRm80]|nr:hypothetical protein NEOKW01_1621 [Nematocida sp. AWRm80]
MDKQSARKRQRRYWISLALLLVVWLIIRVECTGLTQTENQLAKATTTAQIEQSPKTIPQALILIASQIAKFVSAFAMCLYSAKLFNVIDPVGDSAISAWYPVGFSILAAMMLFTVFKTNIPEFTKEIKILLGPKEDAHLTKQEKAHNELYRKMIKQYSVTWRKSQQLKNTSQKGLLAVLKSFCVCAVGMVSLVTIARCVIILVGCVLLILKVSNKSIAGAGIAAMLPSFLQPIYPFIVSASTIFGNIWMVLLFGAISFLATTIIEYYNSLQLDKNQRKEQLTKLTMSMIANIILRSVIFIMAFAFGAPSLILLVDLFVNILRSELLGNFLISMFVGEDKVDLVKKESTIEMHESTQERLQRILVVLGVVLGLLFMFFSIFGMITGNPFGIFGIIGSLFGKGAVPAPAPAPF